MSASCLDADEETAVTGFKVLDDCDGASPCAHTVVFSLKDGGERMNKRDAMTIFGLYHKKSNFMDPHFARYAARGRSTDPKSD